MPLSTSIVPTHAAADAGSGITVTSKRLRIDAVSPAVRLNLSWMPMLLVTGTALTVGPKLADDAVDVVVVRLNGWSCMVATVTPSIWAW